MNTPTAGINPDKLIQLDQRGFPHSVSENQLIETHISWVLLTGEFAYKIKKPVRFDFLDYTDLQQRYRFCLEEVELNRRYAPEIYEQVVPIYQVNDHYWFGELAEPDGKLVDYAVKMKQFPQSALVASRLNSPQLTGATVEQFGRQLAQFHQSILTADHPEPFCHPVEIHNQSQDNFIFLTEVMRGSEREKQLRRLEGWSYQEFLRVKTLMEQRKNLHLVRKCHGDLHLKNMIQLPDGKLLPFDGIEFNEAFQWNDISSEVAFPFMDFCARGRPDLGWRLLNAWMEETEDYVALELIRFYTVYRAMVRAKVTWLNPAHHTPQSIQEHQIANSISPNPLAGPWDRYLQVAQEFAFERRPQLVITHGFSGSGKSTHAMHWIEKNGGIRLRTDAIRKSSCHCLSTTQRYSPAINRLVYSRAYEWARMALQNQINAVVDATFLNRQQRTDFHELAVDLGVPFSILDCSAPLEEMERRIQQRQNDPSEASLEVLHQQIKTHEPLTSAEKQFVLK